jgi:hypothetical protein
MNYEEIWYTKTIERSYDVDQSKVVDKTINGFDAFRTFSSSLGTTIYGTFNFGNDKKIDSSCHETFCFLRLHSSFEKYYNTYATDATGTMIQYSRFENGYGAPGLSNANTLGFDLSNTFEASDE